MSAAVVHLDDLPTSDTDILVGGAGPTGLMAGSCAPPRGFGGRCGQEGRTDRQVTGRGRCLRLGTQHCPAHFDMLAICAFIGPAGRGMSAISMRSAFSAAS
jgi:hypothetical protein